MRKKMIAIFLFMVLNIAFFVPAYGAKNVGKLENEMGRDVKESLDKASDTGWKTSNGYIYYYVNGKKMTGWWKEGASKFYLSPTGSDTQKGTLMTGFQKIDGHIYYFKKNGEVGNKGRMLKGWQKIYGRYYYFKKSGPDAGRMLEGGWKKIDGKYFYFEEVFSLPSQYSTAGSIKTSLQKIGYDYYYFRNDGGKGKKGELRTGFVKFAEGYRYFKVSGSAGKRGKMLRGWNRLDGKIYYFSSWGNSEGIMATGKIEIYGIPYEFDSTGALIMNKYIELMYYQEELQYIGVNKASILKKLASDVGGMVRTTNNKYPDLYYKGNNMQIGYCANPVYGTQRDEYNRIVNSGNKNVRICGAAIGDSESTVDSKLAKYHMVKYTPIINGKRTVLYRNSNSGAIYPVFKNGKLASFTVICAPTS